MSRLNDLEEAIISGPINTTAYYIFKHLQKGDTECAAREYQNDGDKLSVFYLKPIREILGCRLHLKIDCAKPLCERLSKELSPRVRRSEL